MCSQGTGSFLVCRGRERVEALGEMNLFIELFHVLGGWAMGGHLSCDSFTVFALIP